MSSAEEFTIVLWFYVVCRLVSDATKCRDGQGRQQTGEEPASPCRTPLPTPHLPTPLLSHTLLRRPLPHYAVRLLIFFFIHTVLHAALSYSTSWHHASLYSVSLHILQFLPDAEYCRHIHPFIRVHCSLHLFCSSPATHPPCSTLKASGKIFFCWPPSVGDLYYSWSLRPEQPRNWGHRIMFLFYRFAQLQVQVKTRLIGTNTYSFVTFSCSKTSNSMRYLRIAVNKWLFWFLVHV